MKNTRLITLLNTLSNKEFREIRKFLKSPLFNNRPEVELLFDYLANSLTLYKVIPSKEQAFKAIHSRQKKQVLFNDQTIRLWMSFLLKAIEKYLIQASFFKDEIKTKTKLAEVYRERNLPKHLKHSLQELEKLQEKRSFRNSEYYTDDFLIQYEHYRSASINRRMSELNLQKMSDNLDIAYLSQKLRQSCLSLSHQTVYKTEYRFGLLPEILNYIEEQKLLDIPAIAVYYYGFQTLSRPDEALFFQGFKKTIVAFGKQFPSEELGDIYRLAVNFCIKRYNEGNREYLQDEFELYQQGMEQELFLQNKVLSRFTYRNIVTIGLVLEEYQWVENFIHEYKPSLGSSYRESIFSFCLALLEYSKKDYGAALTLLQKSPYKDLLLNLAAKAVMLKIFYELDEFDTLDAHLDAMRTFIRRKKIIAYHQENYLNLIQFTKRLMESNPYDKSGMLALRREIESTKSTAEKDWLLRQFM